MKRKQYSSRVNTMFMKTFLPPAPGRRWLIPIPLLILMTTTVKVSVAQLADCATGTVMYSIWNDSTGSAAAKPSEIRSVNYATGAVGPLMGGVTFMISKVIGVKTYYGSAAVAVDGITKEFFVNTQMSNPGGKDIIRINTLTNTKTIIGTTPSAATVNVPIGAITSKGLDDYHFVKMAISPTGTGYAIGVLRDTTLGGYSAASCNPLISFSTCGVGVPTAGCSTPTIKLLGFLPGTGLMTNWKLFNGDIAFDAAGNLFFATAAFAFVNGIPRYTDSRLFEILSTNIPAVPGTGTIPMSFVADYNTLDSTVINGIAFSPVGKMYLSTRRFNGVQTSPVVTPFTNELYQSASSGSATLMPGFVRPTVGYSIADLGGCYFPLTVLESNQLSLSGHYSSGNSKLVWESNRNTEINYFEVQRSDDGAEFTTIAQINPKNTTVAEQSYSYDDPQTGFGNPKFYRIRQVMYNGMRLYSTVIKINLNSKINFISKPKPNPFISFIDVDVQLKSNGIIKTRLTDQSGRIVYSHNFNGQAGENKLNLDDVSGLRAGIYILELTADDEIIREKVIKQ